MPSFFKRGRDHASVSVSERGMSAKHDSRSAIRARNLNLLMTAAGGDKDLLAAAVEMVIPRVAELLEGTQPVSNEVAQHIEAMLEIEAGWLDRKHEVPIVLSAATQAILRGEAVSSLNQAATEELEEVAPPTTQVPAPQKITVIHRQYTGAPAQLPPSDTQESTLGQSGVAQVPQSNLAVSHSAAQAEKPASKQSEELQNSNQEAAMADEKTIYANRRENLDFLTSGKGYKSKMARLMGATAGHITLLVSGARPMLDGTSHVIEVLLGLPKGWLDEKHTPDQVPDHAVEAIFHEKPVAVPTVDASKPRRGRPLTVLKQHRDAMAAAAEEQSPPEVQPKKRGRPPQNSAAAAAVKRPGPVVHISPPAATVAPAAAPVATAAAAPVATPPRERTFLREAAAVEQAPTTAAQIAPVKRAGLSPIVEAVVRTISEHASAGRLTDAVAYRLLGELSGLN